MHNGKSLSRIFFLRNPYKYFFQKDIKNNLEEFNSNDYSFLKCSILHLNFDILHGHSFLPLALIIFYDFHITLFYQITLPYTTL